MNIRLEFQKHFISWKASTLPNKFSKEAVYTKILCFSQVQLLHNTWELLSPPPPQKKGKMFAISFSLGKDTFSFDV